MSSGPVSPLVLVNAVGLTRRVLSHCPTLQTLAQNQGISRFVEVLPAVTMTAQASLLTGTLPCDHGIVANGWLFRDTGEVRFWQQANALVQKEPFYATAARVAAKRGLPFRSSQFFWWFNQGARVDTSLTPKPWYGADGDKRFGISGQPQSLAQEVERQLGPFPFASFWGPRAGWPATDWISRAAAWHLEKDRPDLLLVYLPHLDYDPQRLGPSGCDWKRLGAELDTACATLWKSCEKVGARMWVVSEYGHFDSPNPVLPNRLLREQGFLEVRDGPFGETIETFQSRAFAVVDHQLAHVYVRDPADVGPVARCLGGLKGVDKIYQGSEKAEIGLDHPRSGEILLLSRRDSWFAYPYWLNEARAPDFARTVDIHRKPGYDPCEMLLDPNIRWLVLRLARRLISKKLGFRTLFDVIPLDPTLVKGSHGLAAEDRLDQPVWIGSGTSGDQALPMTSFKSRVLEAMGLLDE